jgi:peptidoglycan/xylan/chitin deacetylase (PgdA/CDA1 family)
MRGESMNLSTATSVAGVAGSRPGPHAARRIAQAEAKNFSKRAIGWVGAVLNRSFGNRAGERAGILTYHRLADYVDGVAAPTWNVTPAAFRAQMSGLLARGFRPWPLRRLIDCHHRGETAPAKTFIVTFDDGHESVYHHAWPVLKEFGIPAAIFLATAYLDRQEPFPFEDWPAAWMRSAPAAAWRPLSTLQCREMAAEGLIELGAHTHTHQNFAARPWEFHSDLEICVEHLDAQFGCREPTFSFPYGIATSALRAAVRQAGLACGLTTRSAVVEPSDDPIGWGRFHVETWDTADTLAAKLEGWYSWAPGLMRCLTAGRQETLVVQ